MIPSQDKVDMEENVWKMTISRNGLLQVDEDEDDVPLSLLHSKKRTDSRRKIKQK